MRSWPSMISDKEAEDALFIVANYLERKYDEVTIDQLKRALVQIDTLMRGENIRNPLLLANKAIAILEQPPKRPHAA